jgi:hypothetical protein
MFAATSLSSATRATCAIKVRGRARKVIDAGGGRANPRAKDATTTTTTTRARRRDADAGDGARGDARANAR